MKKYNKQVIIENLKKYRKINNLTQEDLAEKLSYSVKAIASWEQGVVVPPLEVLIDFSSELNMKLEEFLGVKEESIFDYISQKTLEKFNYSLSRTIKLWHRREKEREFIFSQSNVDEGGFVVSLNQLDVLGDPIEEIVKIENKKLIFNFDCCEKGNFFKSNYEYLKENFIFKMLQEEGLITLEENKTIFDPKISEYIIKAMASTKEFACMKEWWDILEVKARFKKYDKEIDPEILAKAEKEQKQWEEENLAKQEKNRKYLNDLLNNKKDC